MSGAERASIGRLEALLAATLRYGTWLATAVILAGLVLAAIPHRAGLPLAKLGIALFILLPVARLVLMLLVFLRQRDYRFAAVAALVLAIVALAFTIGTLSVG